MWRAAILGALAGGGAQLAVNKWTATPGKAAEDTSGGWLGAKFSAITKLTDREYENILEEKILVLDAEIAIIDDDIAALRAQKEDQQGLAAKAEPQTPSSKNQS